MKKNDLTVVIMAAGSSKRLNSDIPKPFIILNKKPVLWYSAYSFQKAPVVKSIYIAINPQMISYADKLIQKHFKQIDKFKGFIEGGAERQDSVYNVLKKIDESGSANYIAIHDAARPFIKQEVIDELYSAVIQYGAAAPGIPVVDTVKICDDNNLIVEHPCRKNVAAIQTPQVFEFSKLWDAYKKTKEKGLDFTDDTEVYAKYFKDVKIIKGDQELFKITFKKDLKEAEAILRKNKKIWK